MPYRIAVFACLFFITPINVPVINAGEDVIDLKPVPVKAVRSALTKEDLPSSITIITEKEIKEKQYTQVLNLLREELGMDVVQSGPPGGQTSVFLRGANSASTLVLVDGIQVNLNTTGAFNFAHLSTDNIERIEILRGPQSTLWGADAVGGVINITTKKGRGKPSHSFTFEGGSFATFRESIHSSGALGKFDYSFGASRTDSDGFSSANVDRGNPEEDGYENTTVSTRLGYNFQEDGRVEFIGRYIRSISKFDIFSFGLGQFTDGPDGSKTETFYLAVPIKKTFGGWWDVSINPNLAYDETFSFNPSFGNSHILNRTYTLDLQNNLELSKFHSIIFGADLQIQNGVNEENSLKKDLYTQGYFLQALFHYFDRLVFTGGFRHDINSVFGANTTYKIDGAYSLKETQTRFHASYATGFRAPSINELIFPFFGTPTLKPEKVRSWEAGVDQKLLGDRVQVGVTYFESDFTDLIDSDPVTFLAQNIAEATSKGVETEIDLKLMDDLSLALRHTWNQTADENDAPLARRAKHKFTATLQHHWQNKLNTLVSVRVRGGARSGTNTSAFTTVRAALSYKVNKNLTITARGENLFDEDYEEVFGLGTAGVSGYGGFTWTFN